MDRAPLVDLMYWQTIFATDPQARERRDDAERAVRESLARIRALVEAMDRQEALLTRIFGDNAEPTDAVGKAHRSLTADDRRLLGMDP